MRFDKTKTFSSLYNAFGICLVLLVRLLYDLTGALFSILSNKLLLSLLLKIYPVVTLIFDSTSWCEGISESNIGNPTVILSNSVFANPSTSEAEI